VLQQVFVLIDHRVFQLHDFSQREIVRLLAFSTSFSSARLALQILKDLVDTLHVNFQEFIQVSVGLVFGLAGCCKDGV
jgi:hypothetical protein